MDFDPLSGALWTQENGDDAFDEINRVTPGFNGGWIQTMGPVSRVDEFRSIEMTYGAGNLQQLRWPPSNIAATPQQAVARMFMLPGAQYIDPEFSWKYAVAPSPIGFVKGRGLGPQFEGDLFVGASRTTLLNGFLFRFKLTADRQHFSFSDPRLADRVADNIDKFDQTESESLVIGKDFGDHRYSNRTEWKLVCSVAFKWRGLRDQVESGFVVYGDVEWCAGDAAEQFDRHGSCLAAAQS
jgi:hypothetical protein